MQITENTVTESLLRHLAGDKAFVRGEEYARSERVELERVDDCHLAASVHGSFTYQTRLEWLNGELRGECNCPVGSDGLFCKHQVAAALCWASMPADDDVVASPSRNSSRRGKGGKAVPSDDTVLKNWLHGLDGAALAAIVMDLAGRDPDCRRQLLARARFATTAPKHWRKAIGDLIGRPRFLDYGSCRIYARRLDTLSEILRFAVVRDPVTSEELADYALHRLFSIYGQSDDSSGALGAVLQDIGDIHRQAVEACAPESGAFAKRYLKLRLADSWGMVAVVAAFNEVLGSKGIATLERLTQAHLDELPLPEAGRGWDENASQRFTLQKLLEELAHFGGDVDGVIARKVQAITGPRNYLDLAAFCRQHGRDRQAHEWLERGLAAFAGDEVLLDALAQSYLREGFPEDALPLRWRAFQQGPGKDTYLALRESANTMGVWDEWREKALAHVQQMECPGWQSREDMRVGLMLAEGNLAEAWRIARDSRLTTSTWAQLAPLLEATEPEGALRAYRVLVPIAVDLGNRQGYLRALGWLRPMSQLHQRLGTGQDFKEYLSGLRQTYRAKRSFIALMDEFSQSSGQRGGA